MLMLLSDLATSTRMRAADDRSEGADERRKKGPA